MHDCIDVKFVGRFGFKMNERRMSLVESRLSNCSDRWLRMDEFKWRT